MRNILATLACMVMVFNYIPALSETYSQTSVTVTKSGQKYNSTTTDLSAVKVTGGTLNLESSDVSSSSNTSSSDNSSF